MSQLKTGRSLAITALILALVWPGSATSEEGLLASAVENEICICRCAYPKQTRISVPGYFQTSKSSSCEAIEGLACLATHRGTSFKGVTANCQNGALPVDLKNPIGPSNARFPIRG